MLSVSKRRSIARGSKSVRKIAASAVRVILENLEGRRLLSAGTLDSTFNSANTPGYIQDTLGPNFGADATAVAVDPSSGDIIAAGTADGHVTIARYHSDGTPDASWVGDGTVTFPVDGHPGVISAVIGSDDSVRSILIRPDGQIVVSGNVTVPVGDFNHADLYAMALNADGSVDTSFDDSSLSPYTEDGVVVVDPGLDNVDLTPGDLVADGNNVYLTGASANETYIEKLTPTGPDNSFGTNGLITVSGGTGGGTSTSAVLQAGGKLVVSAGDIDGGLIERVDLSTGSLDTSFGPNGDGIVRVEPPIITGDFITGAPSVTDLAQDSAGDLLALFQGTVTTDTDTLNALKVNRYDSDGNLDATYGAAGTATLVAPANDSYVPFAMTVDSQGRAVVTGAFQDNNNSTVTILLSRFTDTGANDASFGTGGLTTTSITGSFDVGENVTLQSDGKIIVAGSAELTDFVTLRYTTDDVQTQQPPLANAGGDQTADEGDTVNFDGSGSTGTGLSYSWDFGDGHTFTSSDATTSHVYADNGLYTVSLTVTDSLNQTSTDTASVTVDNVAPMASITGTPSIHVLPGTPITLGSSVTDPGTNDTFTYAWTVTKNSNPFASGTSSSITFTPDAVGTYGVTLVVTDKDGGASTPATASVQASASSVSGIVYDDANNNGQVDLSEGGIAGVTIHLTGTDDLGHSVSRTLATDSDGAFVFLNLRPGTYALSEDQPAGYSDGLESLGTAGGTIVTNGFNSIILGENQDGFNYNFGELIEPSPVQPGQAAQVGFWQNKNGQKLITSLNGSANATNLGNWLASNYPHMFGAQAGADNLAGKTNSFIASFYQQQFKLKGQKLDANVLATALSVYVTNSTLAGSAGTPYGFIVDSSGLGVSTWNVGTNGAAFGVANNSTVTIFDLLTATDSMSVNGTLYGTNSTLRSLAFNVYSAINAAGNIA